MPAVAWLVVQDTLIYGSLMMFLSIFTHNFTYAEIYLSHNFVKSMVVIRENNSSNVRGALIVVGWDICRARRAFRIL
ncbi:hypothetical protein KP509_28G006200 [Ceratopteris richardii]|uniref:Uncharacterized protein n=1 Tax=Ceratopteris richardii TaxID=49495 RepID=A0A8T2RBD6_CERRI|nr:hypothetical protein KP509_28G006200 [Ceratopteris richardii]